MVRSLLARRLLIIISHEAMPQANATVPQAKAMPQANAIVPQANAIDVPQANGAPQANEAPQANGAPGEWQGPPPPPPSQASSEAYAGRLQPEAQAAADMADEGDPASTEELPDFDQSGEPTESEPEPIEACIQTCDRVYRQRSRNSVPILRLTSKAETSIP